MLKVIVLCAFFISFANISVKAGDICPDDVPICCLVSLKKGKMGEKDEKNYKCVPKHTCRPRHVADDLRLCDENAS